MLEKFGATFWSVIAFLQEYDGAVTALATVAIGIFTFSLVIVTNRQARLTREAIAIARADLISTHYPRIVLRDAHLVADRIIYLLTNTGAVKATVVESLVFDEFVEDGSRIAPLRSADHDYLGRLVFEGGETKDLTRDVSSLSLTFIKSRSVAGIRGKVYFVGALIYEDVLGIRRRSIFRRLWDDASLTFVRLPPDQERDHEYAD